MSQSEQTAPRDAVGEVDVLTRREIEAQIAAPLLEAFMQEFGHERALAVAQRVIRSLALASGRSMGAACKGNSVQHLLEAMRRFAAGGALEIEPVAPDCGTFGFDVVRCRYAEMYKAHGLQAFGPLLSCARDYALVEGFNPRIRLTRTQTIMEGGDRCDFRFTMDGE